MAEGTKRLYPAFVDLEGRLCVVVGQGPAAEKRARQLARYQADVVIVTPEPSEELVQAEADGHVSIEPRTYVRGDLQGATLALCLTDDEELRRAVHEEAESVGCLVNVAGSPAFSSFVLPSVLHREPLQIAVSTGGVAPEAAKAIRDEIKRTFGEGWSAWIALLIGVRARASAGTEEPEAGRRALEIAARDETRERILGDESVTADEVFAQAQAEIERDARVEIEREAQAKLELDAQAQPEHEAPAHPVTAPDATAEGETPS